MPARNGVIIIGGGPSGLFCALQVAGTGREVLVLEKMPSCGRKLSITGSGQCNLTNNGDIRAFFSHYGDHGKFLRPALLQCPNTRLIRFFEDQGLQVVADDKGKVFPATRKATDLMSVLLTICRVRGVTIRCKEAVQDVVAREGRFLVSTAIGEYFAEHLVVATGGMSYPATGSSGDGYSFAIKMGHTVTPLAPALTPVVIEDHPLGDLSGISFESVIVSLVRVGKTIRVIRGDLLLTHTGLSGPGVLDLSRHVVPGDFLKVSFVPDLDKVRLSEKLLQQTSTQGGSLVKRFLSDLPLPERFVRRILEVTGIPPALPFAQLSKTARSTLITNITAFPFRVAALGGFEIAMVTRGGVSLAEVNPLTMESRLVPGLFWIGEVLDIDGDTGGYNLQAAFSTATAAASGICSSSHCPDLLT